MAAAQLHMTLGTERVTKDGIRQRKVRDDGPPQRRRKSMHMILWEETRGPVPTGPIVVFKDRNTQNIEIGNLNWWRALKICDETPSIDTRKSLNTPSAN